MKVLRVSIDFNKKKRLICDIKMKEIESSIFCHIKDAIFFCPILGKVGLEQELQLTKITSDTPDVDNRKILNKIDLTETFEKNFKNIQPFKTNELKNLLLYLNDIDTTIKTPSEINKLKSDGLALEKIKRIYNLIDHTCTICWSPVKNDR